MNHRLECVWKGVTENLTQEVADFWVAEGAVKERSQAILRAAKLLTIVRDDSGAQIAAGVLSLPSHGHIAHILADDYPAAAGIRGTVEIDAPAGSQVSALGLRFTPSQNITTIPVLAK